MLDISVGACGHVLEIYDGISATLGNGHKVHILNVKKTNKPDI